MSNHFGIPGVGGSLGLCAICGDTFLEVILLGTTCQSFHVPGIDKTLYGHHKCLELLEDIRDNKGGDWHVLPEGPLRRCFAEVHGKPTEEAPSPSKAVENQEESSAVGQTSGRAALSS